MPRNKFFSGFPLIFFGDLLSYLNLYLFVILIISKFVLIMFNVKENI